MVSPIGVEDPVVGDSHWSSGVQGTGIQAHCVEDMQLCFSGMFPLSRSFFIVIGPELLMGSP